MALAHSETGYGLRTTVRAPFDEAVERTRAALKTEGFGVLTEIDVQATLREKLGVDFRRYLILGACNPPLAYRAFQAEEEIGLLLPCNVAVYEQDDGSTTVSVMDPVAGLRIANNPALEPIANEARTRLERALGRL